MSHTSSNRWRRWSRWRSDAAIAANLEDVALLRAVVAGRVLRGAGGERGINAPHLLDGHPVRLPLRHLASEDLIDMPISGPPTIAPRGRRLLELANGEVAGSLERHTLTKSSVAWPARHR